MHPLMPKKAVAPPGSWQNARATGGVGILPAANSRGVRMLWGESHRRRGQLDRGFGSSSLRKRYLAMIANQMTPASAQVQAA